MRVYAGVHVAHTPPKCEMHLVSRSTLSLLHHAQVVFPQPQPSLMFRQSMAALGRRGADALDRTLMQRIPSALLFFLGSWALGVLVLPCRLSGSLCLLRCMHLRDVTKWGCTSVSPPLKMGGER